MCSPHALAIASQLDEFALIVSMSHLIGDGFTFHRIRGMITGNDEATPLEARRYKGFTREAIIFTVGAEISDEYPISSTIPFLLLSKEPVVSCTPLRTNCSAC